MFTEEMTLYHSACTTKIVLSLSITKSHIHQYFFEVLEASPCHENNDCLTVPLICGTSNITYTHLHDECAGLGSYPYAL